MRTIALSTALILLTLAVSAQVQAQFMTVELERPYLASRPSAIVVDPKGSPLSGASVTRMNAGWKKAIEGKMTNADGRFKFNRKGLNLYYLEITLPGFQVIHVKLKISRRATKTARIRVEIAT